MTTRCHQVSFLKLSFHGSRRVQFCCQRAWLPVWCDRIGPVDRLIRWTAEHQFRACPGTNQIIHLQNHSVSAGSYQRDLCQVHCQHLWSLVFWAEVINPRMNFREEVKTCLRWNHKQKRCEDIDISACVNILTRSYFIEVIWLWSLLIKSKRGKTRRIRRNNKSFWTRSVWWELHVATRHVRSHLSGMKAGSR